MSTSNYINDSTDINAGLKGGALIGLSAAILLLASGKVMGISGISNVLLNPSAIPANDMYKIVFITTMMISSNIFKSISPEYFVPLSVVSPNYLTQLIAGALVGFGTSLGNGCTSGHGICGLARFSYRSLSAVCTFMLFGIATQTIVSTYFTSSINSDVGSDFITATTLTSTISLCLTTFVLSLLMSSITTNKQSYTNMIKQILPSLVSAILFTCGLVVSKMSDMHRVKSFLNVNVSLASYDATLMFVMGSGVIISILGYEYKKRANLLKPHMSGDFSAIPSSGGSIDVKLVAGSVLFGVGWGLGGLCPGPAIVNAAIGTPSVILAWLPAYFLGKNFANSGFFKKPDLTAPINDQIFCIGVNKDDEHHEKIIKQHNIKSWLTLIPANSTVNSPDVLPGVNTANTRRVLVDGSNPAIPLSVAEGCINALDELPRPTIVMCKSGARATAVARMYLASKKGIDAGDVIAAAGVGKEAWVKSDNVRTWVERSLPLLGDGKK